MVVGEEVNETDVVVLGGGPGGYTAAVAAAREGARTLLIEARSRLGGVCLNVGCIPSKALIHVADLAALPTDARELGLEISVGIDMKAIQARIDKMVDRLSRGIGSQLADAGVGVVQGRGRFVSPRRLAVDLGTRTTFVEFRNAIIATGSRPIELPSLPFDGRRIIDSTGALAIEEVPRSVAVVGGGYIGLELGTVLAKLGSRVTIVEMRPAVLAELDPSVVRPVLSRLADLGVTILTGARIDSLDDGKAIVRRADETLTVEAEVLVVAAGRCPNTEHLDLDLVGATVGPLGHVAVDDSLRASPTALAVGDVTLGPQLAHRASAQAEVAGAVAAGRRALFQPAAIPSVVYTDPEIVSIGMTMGQARAAGIAAEHGVFPLSASGRAATLGRTEGRIEIVVDGDDRSVVGVHMVGVGVSELSGEASLALEMQVGLEDLALTVHAHPTLSEALKDAAANGMRSFSRR